MLAIATTLVSLGTDPVNAYPVPCGQGDIAATSFAKSFAENSAFAGDAQALSADSKILKDAAGTGSALAKSAAVVVGMEAQGDLSAGTIIQNEPDVAKNLITAIRAKAVIPVSRDVKGKVTGVETLPQRGNSNEGATVGIQIGVPEGLLSLHSVEAVTPELSSGTIDGSKVIGSDEVITPHPDIAASAMLPILHNGEKPVIQNRKVILITEENQEDIQAGKETKGHDVGVKKENSAKIKKTDKAIGLSGNAVGIVTQTATVIPVIVLPQDGQSTKISVMPDEGDISSITATTVKQRIGTAASSDSNAGKKPAGSGQLNAGDIKAQDSAVADDLASQKSEIEAAKNTTPTAAATAGSSSKAPSAVAAVTATAPKRADEVASATGLGVAAVPAPPAGTQAAVGSHAALAHSGAGMQVGAGAIDAGPPIDEAHRTLTATPTSLEVGVANGSHGWLKIRAEMGDGGVVNASLSTASSSGQEILHRQLPSLTAYLQSEHVALNAVVVQPALAVATDPRGHAGSMNGNGSGQAQQRSGQGGDNRQDAVNTAMDRMEKRVPYNSLSGIRSDELLPLMPDARGGSWLSVRA